MSDYSYAEIQNMQQKAMARVRQMQRNSEAFREKAQEELDENRKTEKQSAPPTHSSQVSAKITNMPPNFPENSQYPRFKDFFQNVQKEESKPAQNKASTLENLFSEPDKAMLTGLIMLLKSEGADELLIMALIYIMS